jgi:hypothetical protein
LETELVLGVFPGRGGRLMLEEGELRADRHREIARELRCTAFKRVRFDLCRKAQLLALASGFDRFADRIDETDRKIAAD